MNMKLEDLTYALMISLLDTKGPSIYYVSTFLDNFDPPPPFPIYYSDLLQCKKYATIVIF